MKKAVFLPLGAALVLLVGTLVAVGSGSITLAVTPQAHLSWSDHPDTSTYRVRRQDGSACDNFTKIAEVAPPATSYDDTTAVVGSTYCYAVTAVHLDGSTTVSNKVAVTIAAGGATATAIPATPTPIPATPTPTLAPTPTPLPVGDNICSDTTRPVVGYGSGTVGGAGGPIIDVSTVAELRAAVGQSGKRIVNMAPGVYDLGGSDLKINKPNLTLRGNGAETKRGSVKITASQVIVRNLVAATGDESPVQADDVDAITINGNAAPRDHIVLDHVVGIWGPDVSGTILGRVTDVTVQCSIFGEGLFESGHSESHDADGHSLAYNIASEEATGPAERVTLYGDLFTTSQSRQPRIIGTKSIDVIDSVFFNYAEGPQGNPQSLNLIGDTWKKGPAPASAGVPFTALLWRYQPGGHGAFDTRFDARVYIAGEQVIGFTPTSPSGDDAAVLRSSPLVVPSVQSIGAANAYAMVASYAGSITSNPQTTRLRSNLLNGTGTYYNGAGYPPPNPTWP